MKCLHLVMLVTLELCSCSQERMDSTDSKIMDTNAGKQKLSANDPRILPNYPTILLLSVKYNISVETAAKIISHFESRFNPVASDPSVGIGFTSTVPITFNQFEEDTHSLQDDSDYFTEEALRYELPTATVAALITDFYLICGSSREFPEPSK